MVKKSNKIIRIIPLIAVIIGSLTGLAYFQYKAYINTPVDKTDNTPVSVQIQKGETSKEIGKDLEENELIKSDLAFYLYIKFNKLDKDIIAGRFLLNKTMTIPQIITTISDPSQAEYIITIQEGLTIKDIDKKLVELELIKSGEFIKSAKDFNGWEYYPFLEQEILQTLEIPIEGYLYPDTYFLDPQDFKPHDLIYLAIDNFEQKTKELLPKISRHSINEIITMASIIENEVIEEKDREIVSGILWKRLENDWTLGADATLLYVTDDRIISQEDLAIDSPYNLRKYKGLPPGPICNPSLESISVAMYPKETPYWFYLTVPKTEEVIYSITNEEHNLNKEKYL